MYLTFIHKEVFTRKTAGVISGV